MRILFLTTPREFFSPVSGGAVATVVEVVARQTAHLGHDVTVAARTDANPPYQTVPFASLGPVPGYRGAFGSLRRGAQVAHNRLRGWHWAAYGDYLTHLRRQVGGPGPRPDVVVAHNDPFVVPYLRRWLPGATVVQWVHNDLGRRSLQAMRRSPPDRTVVVSAYIRDLVLAATALPPDLVTVVHNGVDLGQFRPRSDFTVPGDRRRVLVLGRLHPNKGTDIAVTACAQLIAEGLPVDLTVAGSAWFYDDPRGQANPWAERLIAGVAAAGGTYLSHVERSAVPELVRSHDIGCVLSRWDDPFPLTVLEYMASGCAVVASPRGGIPEAADGAAVLVDPEDPAAVADALRRLVTDTSSLVDHKHRSVERARRGSWDATTRAFLDLVADGGGR